MAAISQTATLVFMAYLCTAVAGAESWAGCFGYEGSYWIPMLICNAVDGGLLTGLTFELISYFGFNSLYLDITLTSFIISSVSQIGWALYHVHKWAIIKTFYDFKMISHGDLKRIDKALKHYPPLSKYDDDSRFSRMENYSLRRASDWL